MVVKSLILISQYINQNIKMELSADLRENILKCLLPDITNGYNRRHFRNARNYKILSKIGFLTEEFYQDCKPYFEVLTLGTGKCESHKCKNNRCYYVEPNELSYGKDITVEQPYCKDHMKYCRTSGCNNKTSTVIHEDEELDDELDEDKYKNCYCYDCKSEIIRKKRMSIDKKARKFFDEYTLMETFTDTYLSEPCEIYVYENDDGEIVELWPDDDLYDYALEVW
jgi:hypothetical protein